MSDLLALAERVEAASGPDRDLDTEILWHVDRRRFTCGYWNAASGLPRELEVMPSPKGGLGWIGAQCSAPAYTTSIDAAMTLVPEGYDWIIGHTNGGLTIHAEVGDRQQWFANTPALALTAAALRARAASTPSLNAEIAGMGEGM
jgi:hypothetical protein